MAQKVTKLLGDFLVYIKDSIAIFASLDALDGFRIGPELREQFDQLKGVALDIVKDSRQQKLNERRVRTAKTASEQVNRSLRHTYDKYLAGYHVRIERYVSEIRESESDLLTEEVMTTVKNHAEIFEAWLKKGDKQQTVAAHNIGMTYVKSLSRRAAKIVEDRQLTEQISEEKNLQADLTAELEAAIAGIEV